jgi:hypothetical protein
LRGCRKNGIAGVDAHPMRLLYQPDGTPPKPRQACRALGIGILKVRGMMERS